MRIERIIELKEGINMLFSNGKWYGIKRFDSNRLIFNCLMLAQKKNLIKNLEVVDNGMKIEFEYFQPTEKRIKRKTKYLLFRYNNSTEVNFFKYITTVCLEPKEGVGKEIIEDHTHKSLAEQGYQVLKRRFVADNNGVIENQYEYIVKKDNLVVRRFINSDPKSNNFRWIQSCGFVSLEFDKKYWEGLKGIVDPGNWN